MNLACSTLLWDAGLLLVVVPMIRSVILSAFGGDATDSGQGRMNSAVGSLTYAAPEVRFAEHQQIGRLDMSKIP